MCEIQTFQNLSVHVKRRKQALQGGGEYSSCLPSWLVLELTQDWAAGAALPHTVREAQQAWLGFL